MSQKNFEKNKASVHKALVNLEPTQKGALIASCTVKGIKVEDVEDTMAILLGGVEELFYGLLKENSNFLSK